MFNAVHDNFIAELYRHYAGCQTCVTVTLAFVWHDVCFTGRQIPDYGIFVKHAAARRRFPIAEISREDIFRSAGIEDDPFFRRCIEPRFQFHDPLMDGRVVELQRRYHGGDKAGHRRAAEMEFFREHL